MPGGIVFERVGTKMVREQCHSAGGHEIRELATEYAQSIIGAAVTLQLLAGSLNEVLETASVADSGP